jgi:hypothetical protein
MRRGPERRDESLRQYADAGRAVLDVRHAEEALHGAREVKRGARQDQETLPRRDLGHVGRGGKVLRERETGKEALVHVPRVDRLDDVLLEAQIATSCPCRASECAIAVPHAPAPITPID